MSFAVNVLWENPQGQNLNTLQFDPGESIHLSVQVRGVLGIPEPGLSVMVNIMSTSGATFPPINLNGTTDLAGNVAWDFTLPSVVAQARATTTVYPVLGTPQTVTQNIGIGATPQSPPGSTSWTTVITYAAVAFAAGMGLYVLAQVFKPKV